MQCMDSDTCCVLCAVCCVLCAVCCVLCAVCCVLCAVCCVLCVAVCCCVLLCAAVCCALFSYPAKIHVSTDCKWNQVNKLNQLVNNTISNHTLNHLPDWIDLSHNAATFVFHNTYCCNCCYCASDWTKHSSTTPIFPHNSWCSLVWTGFLHLMEG